MNCRYLLFLVGHNHAAVNGRAPFREPILMDRVYDLSGIDFNLRSEHFSLTRFDSGGIPCGKAFASSCV